MTEKFKKQLIESDYIRKPLKVNDAESQEVRHLKKEVLETRLIDDMTSLSDWHTVTDHAVMELSDKGLKFSSPTRIGHYEGAKYRIISQPAIVRRTDREDWREWNRISVWIYPDMPGFHSIVLRVQLLNDGEHKVPDRYEREGQHNMNLKPNQWNHMTVEIPYVYRDCVTGLSFEYDMCGHEPKGCETAVWYLRQLEIQKVDCDKYIGWEPGKDRIAFSHSGYQAGSRKTAIASGLDTKVFKLLELETGRSVLEKEVTPLKNDNGEFQIMDFSEVTEPGRYLLMAGNISTRAFIIGDDCRDDSIWKLLNFYLTQRCGYAIPGLHGVCHTDSITRHPNDGRFVVANGGWHDAADMSQNSTTSSQATYSLFQFARQIKATGNAEKVCDPMGKRLYERLIEEGNWGLDWLLKTRFGDGYRVLSCGTSCWTDGIHGTQDDVESVAQNIPIENMMAAGACAIASYILREAEPEKAAYALKVAKEDWQFGYDGRDRELFRTIGDPARILSPLLAYSTAAWSAVEIYRVCGDEYYKEKAVECARYVMDCQQTEYPEWDIPVVGFFWRDKERTMIQHYNHRSHESEPIMAFQYLMEEFPDHPDYMDWYQAVLLYSEYQRFGVSITAPFEMAPASIYYVDEPSAQPKIFSNQQPHFNEDMQKDFRAQVEGGVKLHEGYYFKRFPVWFSFRGNHAPVMSSGRAAAICGKLRNDYDIAEIAQRQMEWIIGRNPFAQSTMYGEGYDFSQMYIQLPGEQVGEMVVGIESWENDDVPFWPQVNTATYKEVWSHSSLRWLWLAADCYGPAYVDLYVEYKKGETVKFINTLSKQVYSLEPEYKTGKVSLPLPAGRYEIEYRSVKVNKTFVAAKKYELNGLMGFETRFEKDGDKVVITVKANGDRQISLCPKSSNLVLDPSNAPDETTFVYSGRIIDGKKPWSVLFIPNGDIREAFDVYERVLL
ncbi:MAG: glycoside hydrolase family 9 protein [Defluviitaleaceae bacterium]|nr:glycoside hydrolase family 9 protein [Defluviitaleaceae bacterium]